MQAALVQWLAAQAEAGIEQLERALPVGHVNAQALARWAEVHVVIHLAGQVGRDMETLRHREELRADALGG